MLTFNHVFKRYPGVGDVLVDVNFQLERGEMAFLTGHSGAGKSTLLKLIAVMEKSSRGQVILGGQNLNRLTERQIPFIRRRLGLIFQDYKLLQDRTVFDNIALPLVVAGYRPQDVSRRVRAALNKVGLSGKEKKYPAVLSGGEQQRVGIARAIVNRPVVILADEPTGNLDPELSGEIMGLFEQFQQTGVTVLIATHDVNLISGMARRVLTLNKGSLL